MTDKELLELAAKAAGITILRHRLDNPICADILLAERTDDGHAIGWNPLTDDGDALRLAVKLNIELRFHLAGDVPGVTATCAADRRLPIPREPWTPEQGDKPAATRRAIVRAAAEIGKAMP